MMLSKFIAGIALSLALSADPFQFEFAGMTDGRGNAYITVIANDNMSTVKIQIIGDGKTINRSLSLKAGSRKKITWKQSAKVANYHLKITGGDMETEFDFEVAKAVGTKGKVGSLKVLSDREEIVQGHKVRYRAPSDLSSYEYKVYDTNGDVIAEKLVTEKIGGGQVFEVSWNVPGEVFMVHTKAENDFGGFTEYKLVPWSAEIPHTEVNFDSGKFDIKGDEEWKVSEALAVALHELVALDKVNKAVNANITPKLYIVGYTDTVGKAPKNKVLSDNRAKAIAKYFYDAGFWAEIYYAGMGEKGLRIQTPDSTDEVRNRRALYLLSVQQPGGGGQIPGRWTKLANVRSMPAGFTLPPYPERFKAHKERRDAQRAGKAPVGGGDDGGSDEGGHTGGSSDYDGSGEYDGDYEGDGGSPPEIEGEPGATGKGCSVHPVGGRDGIPWGLVVLAAVRRRRSWLG